MSSTKQSARLIINAQALIGALVLVTVKGKDPIPLADGHEAVNNLKPGDKVTIEIKSDDAWLAAAQGKEKRLQERQDAASKGAGKGQTLEQGLKTAAKDEPQIPATGGSVVDPGGPTRTRSTR